MTIAQGNPEIQEEKVIFAAADVTLEGRLAPGGESGGVVLTSPHPLYGGDMDNNVVWTAARAFQNRHWTTLRFNFRGVGLSTGDYGGGQAEVADIRAAMHFLATRVARPQVIVGYSFGAAVASRALIQGTPADDLILIAPPIALMEINYLPETPRLRLIIVGDRDDFCPLSQLEYLFRTSPLDSRPKIRVLPGCSHFFAGFERSLYDILQKYQRTLSGSDT